MPLTTVSQGLLSTDAQYTGFKNRLINGGMAIAQRSTGALTVNSSSGDLFPVDRFQGFVSASSGVFTAQQSSDVPTGSGFSNSVILTVTTADASLASGDLCAFRQIIEGFNSADLMWGTANAQPVALSFWVKSSVAGTHSGNLTNNDWTRSYAFSYTITAANTWQYITITAPGAPSGTWGSTNNRGIQVVFNVGAASANLSTANTWVTTSVVTTGATGSVQLISTLGATWQVTGVQLEKGSTATSFDTRSYGTEMMLCQRYYQQHGFYGVVGQGQASDRNSGSYVSFFVPMRTNPSTIAKTYDVDIGDLNISFTPLTYTDRLGQGIGFRPYRNVSTSITRGDTMEIMANDGTEGGPRHPFNAEL